MSKNKSSGIDLTLFNKLSDSLQKSLEVAEKMRESPPTKELLQEYVLEMSKAMGYCASLSQESSMLMLDIMSLIRAHTGGGQSEDVVSSLASIFKLPTDKTGGGKN